ncbi:hypothetical protein ACHAWF_001382 [Thalassiosira exigua]
MDDADIQAAIDGLWIFTAGVLCFLMQAGFGLLEVGSIRAKNAQNVLLKNLLDGCAAALAYWAVGFGLALGEGGNPFWGQSYFFLIGYEDQLVYFFFFYVFAGTTATIVSGAVAERCRFRAYLIYTFVLTGFIYPVASHWIWSPDGFFHGRVIDYAAGGAVHMVGGAAALSGAWVLGPRIGRFEYDESEGRWISKPIRGHNAVLAATGTFILWFGFFPFNAASGFTIVNEGFVQVGRAATVTALAGASGCLTLLWVGYRFREGKTVDLGLSMNGLLSGMVATCSGVGYFDPWAGIPIGATGALSYYAMAALLEKLRIDDPLGAAPVHLGAGAWGMFLVAFFVNGRYMDDPPPERVGIFFGGNGVLLGWQLAAIALDFAWPMVTCSIMFGIMKKFGIFRVSEEAEKMGMDSHHHGGAAYHWGSVVLGRPGENPPVAGELVGETEAGGKRESKPSGETNSGDREGVNPAARGPEAEGTVNFPEEEKRNSLRRRRSSAVTSTMPQIPAGCM